MDRMDSTWIITKRLQPKVIHMGLQDGSPNHAVELAIILAEHQDARGLRAQGDKEVARGGGGGARGEQGEGDEQELLHEEREG